MDEARKKDLILESLIMNESMIHDMLVEYSKLRNWKIVYREDIDKLNNIRTMITEMGGVRCVCSTETWE